MKIKNQKFPAFLFTLVALGSSSLFAEVSPPVGVGNISPGNGATGISIHPELNAKIADSALPPILYRFELYTGFACSGTSLQSSGLQASTSWIPPNNLNYSTIYSWRNRAQDAAGNYSSFGPCWSFTTVPPPGSDTEPPSPPLDLRATPVSPNQIYLSWSASTDNVGVAGYKIFRSMSDAGPYVVIATTNSTNFTNSSLAPSTRYFYFVHAYDNAGNESGSAPPAIGLTFPSSGGGTTGGGKIGPPKPVIIINNESAY